MKLNKKKLKKELRKYEIYLELKTEFIKLNIINGYYLAKIIYLINGIKFYLEYDKQYNKIIKMRCIK